MPLSATELRVATFNVSMEASNYISDGDANTLVSILADGQHSQVKNIAAIIQRVRPDILLLNEFDYIADADKGIKAFIRNYLNKPQSGSAAIDYPYFYYSTVNTGQPSPYDLDNDGTVSGIGADAWGYGFYPGQYGMVLLSRFPIETDKIRTFQHFKWKDMPGFLPTLKADGTAWYSTEAWQQFPLSSKSHWDIPVNINGKIVHILASHPTPPVFDGPEDRNGIRNHDEIRFWTDYISADKHYMYDDQGNSGGLTKGEPFIIVGDLNASPDEGDAINDSINRLLQHPEVNPSFTPVSKGAVQHSPDNPHAASHTAAWRMRADYVLPSVTGFDIKAGGVFWPPKDHADYPLIGTRNASSDHRLVWLTLTLERVDVY